MEVSVPTKMSPARKPATKKRIGASPRRGKASCASPHFAVVHPDAAGIDIGGQSHWVAVPPERPGETVREFSALTHGLHAMVDWLQSHGVRTVAMEATGVLWIPVFELLESRGFEVFLVNASHVKNVSGRKTDLLDCQWIQKLHACGLLQRSFRPADKVVVLRSYVRQRAELVRGQTASTLRMQKALVQMNLQLHLVVADVTGLTGLAIIRKIIDGERDPQKLSALRDPHCRRSQQEIAEALRGTFRAEHVFALRQALATWEHLDRQVEEIDQQIEQALAALDDDVREDPKPPLPPPEAKVRRAQKALGFDARALLYQKTGTDLTRVLGISLQSALTIVSEIGTDMTRWPTVRHFASWLNLAPNTRISGGKELSSRVRKSKNRAAHALRLCASTLARSQTPLGAFYRRKLHKGKPVAITATAHRLARCVYALLRNGAPYLEERLERDRTRDHRRQLAAVTRSAAKLGFSLVPATEMSTDAATAAL